MPKTKLGPRTLIYPMPTFLVGANIENKPNFMAVAWGGIANGTPPMISVAIRHSRYTYQGIRENGTFSVNIPSTKMVKETDYCGIISGSKVEKIETCKFKIFYGVVGTAPMIKQCPVNLECTVAHTLDLGSHVLIIGKIEETYLDDNCLTDGKPDITKIKPFMYTSYEESYRQIGDVLAKAFHIGKSLKEKQA